MAIESIVVLDYFVTRTHITLFTTGPAPNLPSLSGYPISFRVSRGGSFVVELVHQALPRSTTYLLSKTMAKLLSKQARRSLNELNELSLSNLSLNELVYCRSSH